MGIQSAVGKFVLPVSENRLQLARDARDVRLSKGCHAGRNRCTSVTDRVDILGNRVQGQGTGMESEERAMAGSRSREREGHAEIRGETRTMANKAKKARSDDSEANSE